MKRLLLAALLVLAPGLAMAQGQLPIPPDCILNFFTNTIAGSATVVSAVFDNRTNACQTWTVDYQASNTGGTISALSLTFQSANGAVAAGTFGSYAGATESGSNPATSTIGSVSTFSNGTTAISWARMSLTLTATGTTTVKGILYGYKTGYPGGGGGGGGSGCAGTISTPCQIGVDASGTSLPALGDANGRIQIGAGTTGVPVTLTTSGLTQIIPATSGKTTTIFHLSVLLASGSTFQLEYGTGTNCGTGTTAITGTYPANFSGATWDPGDLAIVPAGNAVCVNLGSSVSGGGVATYSQP